MTSSLKLLCQFEYNSICSLQVKREKKIGSGHMTKMAAMPFMGEILFSTECLETWYVASGPVVLLSLYTWCPWVDLDLFYGKVKFGP